MERSERTKMASIKRQLERNLSMVDELLKTADTPRRLSDADIKNRVAAICKDIRDLKHPATVDQLRQVTVKHGMPYAAIGALFAGGYLRKTKAGVVLASRGQKSLDYSNHRVGRRASKKAR